MTVHIATPATGAPRLRRSNLAVPGSSRRMIDKAKSLRADQIFIDLEDGCAAGAKAAARLTAVEALTEGGFGTQIRAVRVNGWQSAWTYQDVAAIVEGAGQDVDGLVLPKVTSPDHVVALDLLLTQLERANGLPVGRIGLEVQIECAKGLLAAERIAAASPRIESVIFGSTDFMASVQMRCLRVGDQPAGYGGDAYHHALMTILVAARAHGRQAIDGPFLSVHNRDGFAQAAARSSALGYDGIWVVHPDQVAMANELFSPTQEDYDHAENILDAYDWCSSEAGGSRGAVMLGDEVIDAACRQLALVTASKGRASGLLRGRIWSPPIGSPIG